MSEWDKVRERHREGGRGLLSWLCPVTMATPLTCSCHTCCQCQSFTLCPFTLCLHIKAHTTIHVYIVHACVCDLFFIYFPQPASINVPWVLAVIMSESWCLAEKAALKGVFRHLALVITLNYYHSLYCAALGYAYVCLCDCSEVHILQWKSKASGQIFELKHLSSYKKSPLCGGSVCQGVCTCYQRRRTVRCEMCRVTSRYCLRVGNICTAWQTVTKHLQLHNFCTHSTTWKKADPG